MMKKIFCTKQLITFGIGFLFLIILGNPAHAEEIQLKTNDDLQKAVSRANAGDTLVLSRGIYHGPVNITKSLTIIGEEGAIIDGGSKGNVITVKANDVVISGVAFQNSGRNKEDSGVYLEKVESNHIEKNKFINVQNGIYIKNGMNHVIDGNSISSYQGHFSTKGNGIHIFKSEGNLIKNNDIKDVQDGIYFDFAKKIKVVQNKIRNSRYACHYMFSNDIYTEGNTVEGNVTGFMVMDSSKLQYYHNRVFDQFDFHGYGILIYDSKNIILKENEIIQNSVGLSLEKAENTEIYKNVVAANQVGLEFRRDNSNNTFSENNFIANIVSSTIGKEEIRLDDGERGNYWDDYKSYDVTGDGIGEIPYKAGSLYDNLLKIQPLWQFYFESPAIIMWSKAESMFPSLGAVEVYDNKPLTEPVNLAMDKEASSKGNNLFILLLGFAFIGGSLVIIVRGRKFR
jgi:nitrous oxidase accessory protein